MTDTKIEWADVAAPLAVDCWQQRSLDALDREEW